MHAAAGVLAAVGVTSADGNRSDPPTRRKCQAATATIDSSSAASTSAMVSDSLPRSVARRTASISSV